MSVWRKYFPERFVPLNTDWFIDLLIDFQMINFFFPLLHATVIRVYASKEYGFS